MEDRSLGLIETWGYTAAVEAVDVACKAARVSFVGYDLIGKGFITVKFSGDVAAVQAAVTAGAAAARKVGRVISVHVIPRPHGQLGELGPGFPGIPGGRPEADFAGGLQPAGDRKPAEDEHPRRTKPKRAKPREVTRTKDSKTKRSGKKPEK